MKSQKKILIVFAISSLIALACNYYIYELNKDFTIVTTEKKLNNTDDYTVEDFKKLNINELKELQEIYYARNINDKCKLVSEIILENFNESDIDTLTILSILSEENFEFEKALEYRYRLLPLCERSRLPVIYDNMADIYLLTDLNKSIELLEKALKINPEDEIVSLKLPFFKSLIKYYNNENKSNYYKKIIESSDINILPSVIEFMNKKVK
ncbi:hypothetical protein HMPREF1092_03300 [Clostridium thermobutyricum]|uniref:Uncharacterized protein n=1 Tax=Clostridium thermobutyricum TaxID=29372 RepID=N9XGD8_9CLOT|nr:hypothetical protein [Clostridium thermobutyricum]ENY98742.1 hypothetical protein HMPREF1092_03300 [Clostridium thermobutyricum]